MVDFKTRIFTESDNDIIGAEVIVFSDQGTRIGSIEIANAEDLNALISFAMYYSGAHSNTTLIYSFRIFILTACS